MKHVAQVARLLVGLTILFGCYAAPVLAQWEPAFDRILGQGKNALEDGDYYHAIRKFQAAVRADPARASIADSLILVVFARIEKLRVDAVRARRQADRAREQSDRLARYFFEEGSTEEAAWAYGPNGRFSVIDHQGERKGDFVWEQPEPFRDGVAIARRGGDYWFVDPEGQAVSEGYDWLHSTELPWYYGVQGDEKGRVVSTRGQKWMNVRASSRQPATPEDSVSLVAYRLDQKWGLINQRGELVLEPQFDDVGSFSEGLARVERDGKYGLINQRGELVLEPQYDRVESFSEGLARVERDGQWGVINSQGELVVEPEYDDLAVVGRRMYLTRQGDRKGFVAFSGYGTESEDVATLQRFLRCDYEEIGNTLMSNYLPVKQNGKWGFIRWNRQSDDTDEPVLLPARYDAVTPFYEKNDRWVARVYVAEYNLEFYINGNGEMLAKLEPAR